MYRRKGMQSRLSMDMEAFGNKRKAMEDTQEKGRLYTAIPHGYLVEMDKLTDEEFGRLIRGLLYYSVMEDFPEGMEQEEIFVNRVIEREDQFRRDFVKLGKSRSEAGRKGAQARWNKGASIYNQSALRDYTFEEGESL